MRLILAALFIWTGLVQDPPPERLQVVSPVSAPEISIWMPRAFQSEKVRDLFIRKPDERSADIVALQVRATEARLPTPAKPPDKESFQKMAPLLELAKFEGTVGDWKGKPVPIGLYEGEIQGQKVTGKVVWLPLKPGTVVLNVWASPISERTMNQDFSLILSGVSGPEVEVPLYERARGRWVLAKVVGFLGLALVWGTILASLRSFHDDVGGVAYLCLFVPIIPLGILLMKSREYPRALAAYLAGIALFFLMFLIER